jgi:hypothetical protein
LNWSNLFFLFGSRDGRSDLFDGFFHHFLGGGSAGTWSRFARNFFHPLQNSVSASSNKTQLVFHHTKTPQIQNKLVVHHKHKRRHRKREQTCCSSFFITKTNLLFLFLHHKPKLVFPLSSSQKQTCFSSFFIKLRSQKRKQLPWPFSWALSPPQQLHKSNIKKRKNEKKKKKSHDDKTLPLRLLFGAATLLFAESDDRSPTFRPDAN